MAARLALYDEQRITAISEILPALEGEVLKGDETAQEIVSSLKTGSVAVKAWQAHEKQASEMEALDTLLDACHQGVDSELEAIEKKAFVKGQKEVEEAAQAVSKTLFPQGLGAIIHVPYQAEATETHGVLLRCKEPHVAAFFKQHKMEEWPVLMREVLDEYIEALRATGAEQEKRKAMVEAASVGRKTIDSALSRLRKYLASKYPSGHAKAEWYQDAIEGPLKRANAAASVVRKRLLDERAKKAATPT